jgi:hypothetical protein
MIKSKIASCVYTTHNTQQSEGQRYTMASEAQRGPVQRLQSAVEHLAGKDDIPEGVYLDACNALKDLHAVTKLFRVTYIIFYIERSGDTPEVARRTCTTIMEQDDEFDVGAYGWHAAFDAKLLPRHADCLPIYKPFEYNGSQMIVTKVEPYLNRARNDEQ